MILIKYTEITRTADLTAYLTADGIGIHSKQADNFQFKMMFYYSKSIPVYLFTLLFTGLLNASENNPNTQLKAEPPEWGMQQIEESHIVQHKQDILENKPGYSADPAKLITIVEADRRHVSIVDIDLPEPLHRFKMRNTIQGEPGYSHKGRFVYLASGDGWVSKFDLYTLMFVAEIRTGIKLKNITVSGDGRYVMAANESPQILVILNTDDLSPIKVIPLNDHSENSSASSAVYTAAPRESFILALKDVTEIWEIFYSDDPPYYGWVHDYRIEGPPEQEPFPVRRITIDDYMDDFFIDRKYEHLIGSARNKKNVQIVDLIIGRKTEEIDLPASLGFSSASSWDYKDIPVLAIPDPDKASLSIIDVEDWKRLGEIEILGTASFVRSQENIPYAWVNIISGPDKGAVQIIDKSTLKIHKSLQPLPDKSIERIEFTRDGRYALLILSGSSGEYLVYDAHTLAELKRIKMDTSNASN
ncbi:MAG: cytochrome C oxidase Cbb3 [Gammaproteobacteria bacterium]|nr:cytochrome C oxidase Cbb3 [Gammaproteobacteria bacterium]